MLRKLLLTLAATAALWAPSLWAVTPYATLRDKAHRFFDHGEWASALAMYDLMLDQTTDSANVFGDAIVAAGMLQLPQRQVDLFTQGINAHLSIDSILACTEAASLRAEQSSLYEQFLYTLRDADPWLHRVIDARLLDYYVYRDNGPGIVNLSRTMLAGLPDNEGFLYTLAHGQLLCGDTAEAIATYSRIHELYPQSRQALLYLGNYYEESNPELALTYLRQALQQRYTPFVAAQIERLTAHAGKLAGSMPS